MLSCLMLHFNDKFSFHHNFHDSDPFFSFSCMHTIYNLLNFDIYTSVKPYNLLLIRILRTILIIPDADIITQVGFQDFNISQHGQ